MLKFDLSDGHLLLEPGVSGRTPMGIFSRNDERAVIDEGAREIHKLMQADYLRGHRTDRPSRCELTAVEDVS